MVFQYFPESDILYIRLAEGTSAESEEVASRIVIDFDANNHVLGIEIEDAGKTIDLSRLEVSELPLVNLVVNRAAAVPA